MCRFLGGAIRRRAKWEYPHGSISSILIWLNRGIRLAGQYDSSPIGVLLGPENLKKVNFYTVVVRLCESFILLVFNILVPEFPHSGVMESVTHPVVEVRASRVICNEDQGICSARATHSTHECALKNGFNSVVFHDLSDF